jgi:hypothetical protein
LNVTPNVSAGDVVIFRGDMIHRTQDSETARVAAVMLMANSQSVIRRQRLSVGCAKKFEMINRNRSTYDRLSECFARVNDDLITLEQLRSMVPSSDGWAL